MVPLSLGGQGLAIPVITGFPSIFTIEGSSPSPFWQTKTFLMYPQNLSNWTTLLECAHITLTKPIQTDAFHIPGWNFQVDFCLRAPVRVTRKGWTHVLVLCDVGWANSIKHCRPYCPSSLISDLWGCEKFCTEWRPRLLQLLVYKTPNVAFCWNLPFQGLRKWLLQLSSFREM